MRGRQFVSQDALSETSISVVFDLGDLVPRVDRNDGLLVVADLGKGGHCDGFPAGREKDIETARVCKRGCSKEREDVIWAKWCEGY